MMKLVKKIILSFFLIYSFNIISVNFNLIIPINIITIGIITLFDIPGMISLFVIKFLCF